MTETKEDADRAAAEELALDMGCFDAARFLRAEIGFSLREAACLVEALASRRPSSQLAASLRARGGTLISYSR